MQSGHLNLHNQEQDSVMQYIFSANVQDKKGKLIFYTLVFLFKDWHETHKGHVANFTHTFISPKHLAHQGIL